MPAAHREGSSASREAGSHNARFGRNGQISSSRARSAMGSWVAARVSLEGGEQVTAISLYGLRGGERSDESVHRSQSELSPVPERLAWLAFGFLR
jgi:hypothetical protein